MLLVKCNNNRNPNRNHNLRISKAPLKSQAHQGTSLFTSGVTNQRGCPKGSLHVVACSGLISKGSEYLLRWVVI